MAELAQDLPTIPSTLAVEDRDSLLVLRIDRPAKRNALNDETALGIEHFFRNLPGRVRAVVVSTTSGHFSSGLDLSELTERDVVGGVMHSRMWHRALGAIEEGHIPVVSALRGAVIGGGLELAAATHIRVADRTAFYALPEGTRGIFVGGGASVRVPRLIGAARTVDMMLTGRVYDAEEGYRAGLTQYLVDEGEAEATAIGLAEKASTLTPASAFGILHVLAAAAEASPSEGLLMESLMAAVAQSTPEAKARLNAFLEGRAVKVSRDG